MSDICHSIVISFYITIVVIPFIPLFFFFYSYSINCTHESMELKIEYNKYKNREKKL